MKKNVFLRKEKTRKRRIPEKYTDYYVTIPKKITKIKPEHSSIPHQSYESEENGRDSQSFSIKNDNDPNTGYDANRKELKDNFNMTENKRREYVETNENLSPETPKNKSDESEEIQSDSESSSLVNNRYDTSRKELKEGFNMTEGRVRTTEDFHNVTIKNENDYSDETETDSHSSSVENEGYDDENNEIKEELSVKENKVKEIKSLVSIDLNFVFTIPFDEWEKLPIIRTNTYNRLGGDWTDIFAKYFSLTNPHCVLAFKYNRIARSERASRYGIFIAHCKHKSCEAVYNMKIDEKPLTNQDILVQVIRTGKISFKNEEKSRFLKGTRREEAAQEMKDKSPFMLRAELVLNADTRQIRSGNLTSVPSKDVLKQVRAEERRYERLSDCAIREVNAIKRTLELFDTSRSPIKGYIQYIGYEPFFIINYCAEQIDLLSEACQTDDCFLYFDATGLSMKRPMDQPKRLYMYCLVLRTKLNNEGIRVAEMITNDHSTPSITNFLMRIRHSLASRRKYRPPCKIEIDFSFAMIHASCRAFNSLDLVNYLKECWKSLSKTTVLRKTITLLHICAAHMLKTFQRMISRVTDNKEKRKFWLYVLARIQTAPYLEVVTSMVQDITTVCMSTSRNKRIGTAINRLKEAVKMTESTGVDVEDIHICQNYQTTETETTNLRMQSPFYKYFSMVIDQAYITNTPGTDNEYHNPMIVSKLLKDYLPFLPLWSGIFVSEPGRNFQEGACRDTNAVVERQFATVKNEVLQKEKNINPGKACRLLYVAVKGLSKLSMIRPKQRKINDDTQEEEIWKRKGKKDFTKKKRSKYFSVPSEKEFDKMSKNEIKTKKEKAAKTTQKHDIIPLETELPFPFEFTDENAMRWGGFDRRVTGISLSNTCTIDNILTAIFIIVCSREDIKQSLSKSKDTATQVVLEICQNEMAQKKWTEAKIKFVTDILQKHGTAINLFGSEFEMAVKHLVKPQTHTTHTYCMDCLESRSNKSDLIELGTGTKNCNSIQDLIFEWKNGVAYHCAAGCGGMTSTFHNFESLPAILFVAVDVASSRGTLINDSLTESICVLGKNYDLFAATINNNMHFCLLVRSAVGDPWYRYDGLRARQRFVKIGDFHCQEGEIIVHLIYVNQLP